VYSCSPVLKGGGGSGGIRNRIKGHRRVRAGDLVPHEWNYRLHPDGQKDAVLALYQEVGFARSLLAYELPDGRLKLIDGHLRREINPDMEVEVEVLDVTEAEARELLLSIDPPVGLGQMQEQLYERLRQTTPALQPELEALWEEEARQQAGRADDTGAVPGAGDVPGREAAGGVAGAVSSGGAGVQGAGVVAGGRAARDSFAQSRTAVT
jgi:hypothetical protein